MELTFYLYCVHILVMLFIYYNNVRLIVILKTIARATHIIMAAMLLRNQLNLLPRYGNF